jgi:heat shock protein HslJ
MSRGRRRLAGLVGVPIGGAAMVLVVAACGSTAPSSSALVDLFGTSWVVTSIGGTPTIAGSPPTMAFDAAGVTGTTGCNTFRAFFVTDGDRIQVSQLSSTDMACPGDRAAQEAAFGPALLAARTWTVDPDGDLHLTGGAELVGAPAAAVASPSPAASATTLPGTGWRLASIDGQAVLDVHPTLAFGADGNASGNGGCNTFNGSYAIDGQTIAFGPLISTKMACAGTIDEVETAYLRALQAATAWSIDQEGGLRLDGGTSLDFSGS